MSDLEYAPTPELGAFLQRTGLCPAASKTRWTPLTGGVSSDIWKVELPGRTVCIKRALSRLKVAAKWEAPVSRNAFEWEWIKFAAHTVPGSVPLPIAHDLEAGLFAMEYLEPARHPVWKQQLMAGQVDPSVAKALGSTVATLHAASRGSTALAQAFATDSAFHAIRLEPYLLATALRHAKLRPRLEELARVTATHREVLVHGDISPKNILVGPQGPVILDAECAWYGDPAFDVAFLLNHLLLKCLVNPLRVRRYLECFKQFHLGYFGEEGRTAVEQRAAALLPALMLARVDGKSPVEYLTSLATKGFVRRFARPLILKPTLDLTQLADRWASELERSATVNTLPE